MRVGLARGAVATTILAIGAVGLPPVAEAYRAPTAETPVPCNAPALINAINSAQSDDVLRLAGNCTYTLNDTTGPLPAINKRLTIVGGPASTIRRSPTAAAFRIFTVNADFVLRGTTIEGGRTLGGGGGIAVNSGRTSLEHVSVQGNSADASGGVDSGPLAQVVIHYSLVRNNTSNTNGGGVGNYGTMNISNSLINENSARLKGGGIVNANRLSIVGSTLARNEAGSVGGGISNLNGGTVSASSTLVQQNMATNPPGGIDNEATGGAFTLARSIVRNNVPTNCLPTPVPFCPN